MAQVNHHLEQQATASSLLVSNSERGGTEQINSDGNYVGMNRPTNESFSESDRYYTASSGGDSDGYDNEDDDGLCIRLDSGDDDDQSLSGLHINLKTLQAVSSMLAHYNPIIQSDPFGNPTFVAPPPPPEEEFTNNDRFNEEQSKNVSSNSSNGSEQHQHEKCVLSDPMTELTNVMEKMTRYNEDCD